MSVFEKITPEGLKAEMLMGLSQTMDTREGSFADEVVGPMALQLYKYYQTLEKMLALAFVDENSGEYIDKACTPYGILRKPGAKAQTILEFMGEPGTVIPEGTVCLSEEGLEYRTITRKEIPGQTPQPGEASLRETWAVLAPGEAVGVGAQYNRETDTITRQLASISGVTAVRNVEPAQGGADEESDVQLLERYHNRLRKPVTGGNVNDYIQWALETDGVGAAVVLPRWEGIGTVKVVIAGLEKEPVDEAVVRRCLEKIERERPVCVEVAVESVTPLPIAIQVSVTTDGTTDKETIKVAYQNAVTAYIREMGMRGGSISINRMAYLLMGVSGVADYSELTLNGGTESITVSKTQVPVLSEVVML